MLVPPLVHTILFYGGFAIGIVGLACVAIGGAATKRRKQPPLPEAVLANKRPRNGVLLQLVGAFALIGGPAASIWLWFHTSHVVFVAEDAAHTPQIRRETWIGDTYPAPHSLDAYPRRRATWIINQSSITLTAQTIGYGDAHTFEPTPIPPGTSLPVDSVDHVGPDDPPPGMITVTRNQDMERAGIAPSTRRVWLTWD